MPTEATSTPVLVLTASTAARGSFVRSMPEPPTPSRIPIYVPSCWLGYASRCAGCASSRRAAPCASASSRSTWTRAPCISQGNASTSHASNIDCWWSSWSRAVASRDELQERIWGVAHPEKVNDLRVNIARLRRKIEPSLNTAAVIVSIPNVGYRLALRNG